MLHNVNQQLSRKDLSLNFLSNRESTFHVREGRCMTIPCTVWKMPLRSLKKCLVHPGKLLLLIVECQNYSLLLPQMTYLSSGTGSTNAMSCWQSWNNQVHFNSSLLSGNRGAPVFAHFARHWKIGHMAMIIFYNFQLW